MAEHNLIGITRVLQRNARYVLGVTVAAMVIGAIGFFARTKQYKASADFFVSNPMYNDRISAFHTGGSVPYFATDEDIDKVMGLARTDGVKQQIAIKSGLPAYYKLDTSKPEDMEKLHAIFNSQFKLERSEFGIMNASYTVPDAKIAAITANNAVAEIGELYKGFFQDMRTNVAATVQKQIAMSDSAIAALTDTLAIMRDKYGIYDIISPARYGIINGTMQNRAPGSGYAIEKLQNVEANKDQFVTDRVRYLSLYNEYAAGQAADEMPLIKMMSPASAPTQPAGLGIILTIIACGIAGFVLSAIWVLFVSFLRSTKE